MKIIATIIALAALSGCYTVRDFPDWTNRQENTINMLINNNNNLYRRVEALEDDVRYFNRHFRPACKMTRAACKTHGGGQRADRPTVRAKRRRGANLSVEKVW